MNIFKFRFAIGWCWVIGTATERTGYSRGQMFGAMDDALEAIAATGLAQLVAQMRTLSVWKSHP